jgi:hypothetical protein
MKLPLFSLSLLSVSACLIFAPFTAPSASAQCVIADPSVQLAIRDPDIPAQQSNKVNMQTEGSCTGNVSVSPNVQLGVNPTGGVSQNRTSSHNLSGGTGNATGISGPTIAVPVNTQVDVPFPHFPK